MYGVPQSDTCAAAEHRDARNSGRCASKAARVGRGGPLLPAASDIGLHIIVTCQMSQAYKATMDKFVGTAFGSGSPTLFLSGEKQDFPSREIIVKKRPPGQAFLVTQDAKEVIQAVYIDPPDE